MMYALSFVLATTVAASSPTPPLGAATPWFVSVRVGEAPVSSV